MPAIKHTGSSLASTTSSATKASALHHGERCFLTNTRNYTNEPTHWITAARGAKRQVEARLIDIGAVPLNFDLNDASNLSMLAPHVHKSLTLYDLIAFAPDSATLDKLIIAVKTRNALLREIISVTMAPIPPGAAFRALLLQYPDLATIHFHLIALHPFHFLPDHQPISILNGTSYTQYYAEMLSKGLPLPPFLPPARQDNELKVNPLLVIMNADFKFRRYKRIESVVTPLQPTIVDIMEKTMELVDLLYGVPELEPTPGAPPAAAVQASNDPSAFDSVRPASGRPQTSDSGVHDSDARARGSHSRGPERDAEDDIESPRRKPYHQRLDHLRTVAEQSQNSADLAEYGRALMSLQREDEWNSDDEEVMQDVLRGGEPFANLPRYEAT